MLNNRFTNLIVLATLTGLIFVGFKPLFEWAPIGISREILVAGIGALFVTLVTLILLDRQSETQRDLLAQQSKDQAEQQEKQKKNEMLYRSRITSYTHTVEQIKNMIKDNQLTLSNMNELPYALFNIQMLESDDSRTTESFTEVVKILNEIYKDSNDEEDVELETDDKHRLIQAMAQFSNDCRTDLNLTRLHMERVDEIVTVLNRSSETTAKKPQRQALVGGVPEWGKIKKLTNEQNVGLDKFLDALKTKFKIEAKATEHVIALSTELGKRKLNVLYIKKRSSYLRAEFVALESYDFMDELASELHSFNADCGKYKGLWRVNLELHFNSAGLNEDPEQFYEALEKYILYRSPDES